uniref:Uncharacterized protein n=1 Tax=Panagrolaimus sp. JU765 TaxID=591449 RepID=A0AC34R9G4_9BILA
MKLLRKKIIVVVDGESVVSIVEEYVVEHSQNRKDSAKKFDVDWETVDIPVAEQETVVGIVDGERIADAQAHND